MQPTLAKPMHTLTSLRDAFKTCGLEHGQTVILHSSMSKIGGWICGGTESLIQALMDVLGDEGTLMMPTQTIDNSDPAQWEEPFAPPEWWQTIRDEMPAYDPAITRTTGMGVIPELFRTMPGVIRSQHATWSLAAAGRHAAYLTADHRLEFGLDERSPIGKLYELDGHVFLLGVGHSRNTSIHLAEYRANYPGKHIETHGCAVLVDDKHQWVTYETLMPESGDFDALGADYESAHPDAVRYGQVGNAVTRLMKVRPLVDYAVRWLEQHRIKQESRP
jgi:aminoglycoside 3-N-acetyltransferase